MDCVSCGLSLPQGVRRCPGCGVGHIACGIIGFFSFFALFNAPVLGLCLAPVQWRLIARSGPLEREAWLLHKR